MHNPSRPHPDQVPTWADQADLLADLALIDLADGQIRPTLSAFRDDDPLLLATLRPFPPAGYHDPIIEVGALAMALGADRLALSLSGRAWSTRDPIPPVLDDVGDLRQHVLVVHLVDGTCAPPSQHTVIRAVTRGGRALADPLPESPGEGWVPRALACMVAERDLQVRPADIADQLLRCEALGHTFAWGPVGLAIVRDALATVPEG